MNPITFFVLSIEFDALISVRFIFLLAILLQHVNLFPEYQVSVLAPGQSPPVIDRRLMTVVRQ